VLSVRAFSLQNNCACSIYYCVMHMHTVSHKNITTLTLTHHLRSSKIQNGLHFWCQLTQVVLEKKPLKRCSSGSLSCYYFDVRESILIIFVVYVAEVLVLIQYNVLVVRTGYTRSVMV